MSTFIIIVVNPIIHFYVLAFIIEPKMINTNQSTHYIALKNNLECLEYSKLKIVTLPNKKNIVDNSRMFNLKINHSRTFFIIIETKSIFQG